MRCDILPCVSLARVCGTQRALSLRAALMRGALVTAANWPVILAQLIVTSLFRLALAVPVVGGVFMVAVLVQADVQELFAAGFRPAAGLVVASLLHKPVALGSFALAVGIVALGGGVVSFLARAGVLATLANGERHAGEIQRPPFRLEGVRNASAFDIESFVSAVRRFGRRFVVLGLWLYLSYALVVIGAAAGLVAGADLAARSGSPLVMPVAALVVSVIALLSVAALQLFYALVQAATATTDCQLGAAVVRVGKFVYDDVRQVMGVFGVVMALVLLATAGSVLATAGLALVAWVPFVGLVVVPLQMAAWLVRGVVFHYLDLAAWSAYQSHYRRHAEGASFDADLRAVRMFGA